MCYRHWRTQGEADKISGMVDWDRVVDDRDQVRAVAELRRSNSELRAALILAGKEIVKLSFGKRDSPVLEHMRQAVRSSNAVEKRFQ
jgi:hypothetical protein